MTKPVVTWPMITAGVDAYAAETDEECHTEGIRAAIMAALKAAPSPWMPIEEAPRDGTMLLLCVDGVIHHAVWQGPVDGSIYSKSASLYNWFSMSGQYSIHDDGIEGWAPIPPLPQPPGDE